MSKKPNSADSEQREVVKLPYIYKNRPVSNEKPQKSRPNSSKRYTTNIDEDFIGSGAFLTKIPSAPSSYIEDDTVSVRSLTSINELNSSTNRPDSSRSDRSDRSLISDVSTLSTTSLVSNATTPTTLSTASAKRKSVSRTSSNGNLKTTHSLPGEAPDFDIRKYALENNVELKEEEMIDDIDFNEGSINLNQSLDSDAYQIEIEELEELMAEDILINQDELNLLRQEIEESMETESINSEALQDDISKFYTEQEDIRQGLEEYISQIKAKKDEDGDQLIEFPKGFDEVINIYGHEIATNAKHIIKRDLWDEPTKEMMDMLNGDGITDQEAMKKISMSESEEEWLQKIHRLDFILLKLKIRSEESADEVKRIINEFIANKQKPARKQIKEFREQAQGIKVAKGYNATRSARPRSASSGSSTRSRPDVSPSQTERKKDVKNDKIELNKKLAASGEEDTYYRLTEEDEEVVSKIMTDESQDKVISLGQGFNPTEEQAKRLSEINEKLKQLVPDTRNNEKGLDAHFDVNILSWDDSPVHLDENIKKDRNTTGNKYLRELHQERQYKEKLKSINQNLSEIYNREQKMNPDILSELLRQAKEEGLLLAEKNSALNSNTTIIKSNGTLSANVNKM